MRAGSMTSPARQRLLQSLAARDEPIWLRTLAEQNGIPYKTAYRVMRWPLQLAWVTATPEDGKGDSKAVRLLYSITDAGRERLAAGPLPDVPRETSTTNERHTP